MPKVRGNAAAKWARRAASAGQEYTEGVQNPRRSWQQATTEAEKAHTAGVQTAIQNRSFAKGVAKAGDAKWSQKTLAKGPQRFAQGVQEGEGDYQSAVAPYLQIIENTQLPPRGPKGDPANIERVRVMAAALRNRKVKGA
jgi:hypothetical protein